MRIRILIIALVLSSDIIVAQDYSKLKSWLAGTWEGTGYVEKLERPQKFTFIYQPATNAIVLSGARAFPRNLDLSSEYTHVDRNQEEITTYFLGDESSADNRQLKISLIDQNHINLSFVFNRHTLGSKLIVHGVFRKVTK